MGNLIRIGHQNIIQVGIGAIKLPKDPINEPLEGLRGVVKSEEHSQELNLSEGCYNCYYCTSSEAPGI